MKSIPTFTLVCCLAVVALAQDTLKVDVEQVQVYAAVTDGRGRFVTDLRPEDFKVRENGAVQKIESFASDDAPLSIGFLFGSNGAIHDNLQLARQTALSFLKAGNLANDYFLIEFNDKPKLVIDYTRDGTKLEKLTGFLPGKHDDADYDAIQMALDKLRTGANPRRVILLFTSGGDEDSLKATAVRNFARQYDVRIYGVTLPESDVHGAFRRQATDGFDVIESAGGEVLVPDNAADFVNIGRRLAVALRNQYLLGYSSTNPVPDGKYRSLEITLTVQGASDLAVHTRPGYYARGPEKPAGD